LLQEDLHMNAGECYRERLFPITADLVGLEADLVIPPGAENLVLLVHSTKGGRHRSNSQLVAETLHKAGLATVAIDLLTLHEEASDWHTKYLLFNANLLAARLGGATDWLMEQPSLRGFHMGYLGIGIEAGAALLAAAEKPSRVGAIVCINGRTDLANAVLSQISAPTLLVVGEEDSLTMRINQKALRTIETEKQLEVVTGASRLNEQPKVLCGVADLAARWFEQHLGVVRSKSGQLVEL
jgi:putative phosphoribosyl transferase